jgi:hypothetical protein
MLPTRLPVSSAGLTTLASNTLSVFDQVDSPT